MAKLKELLSNIKNSPVKTILGLIAGAATWLAVQPDIDHLTKQGVGTIAMAAALAIWGGISQDSAQPKVSAEPK